MAKAKGPTGGKTIIDVAHPGQSAPSGNSKSVIVSNRPLLKDPMVVDNDISPDDDSLAKVSNKSTAQPSTAPLLVPVETEKTDDKPASVDDSLSDEPAADKPVEPEKPAEPPVTENEDKAPKEAAVETKETVETPEPKAEKPDQTDQPELPKPSEPEAKPADADAKPAETKPDEKPDESSPAPKDKDKPEIPIDQSDKEAEHQAAIDKLADSKKYYLPINTVEKRRSRRFVVLGIVLSLLLALAWADIALDAGLIHINNVKPLTHFFSN